MSLNLELIKKYGDHPQQIDKVYDVALELAKELPESLAFVETGTRSGGSALAIMQAIVDSGNKNRWFFTIDPYGMKPYKQAEEIVTLDYGEKHYRNAMDILSSFAIEHNLNHAHYRMKSTDWFKVFEDTEFWYEGNNVKLEYGFAYLDGDHDSDTVMKEYTWLHERGCNNFVVDDAHYLKEDVIKMGNVDGDRLYMKVGGDEK